MAVGSAKPRLTDNTVVRHPGGTVELLTAGMTVPAWAADQVGAHLLTDDVDEHDDSDSTELQQLRQQLAAAQQDALDARAEAEAARRGAPPATTVGKPEPEDKPAGHTEASAAAGKRPDTDTSGPTSPASSGGTGGGVPPRAGTGSGREAWAAYAAQVGVTVPAGAGREQIIAMIAEAGKPTE